MDHALLPQRLRPAAVVKTERMVGSNCDARPAKDGDGLIMVVSDPDIHRAARLHLGGGNGTPADLFLESDLHMMEPDDLWTRYLDEPFRSSNPPRFLSAQQQQLTPSSEDKGNADRIEGIEY